MSANNFVQEQADQDFLARRDILFQPLTTDTKIMGTTANLVWRKPISARDNDLMQMPSIASQFPVTFDNGMEWFELECYCKQCNGLIREDMLSVSVVKVMPSVAVVEGVGVCPSCRLLTRFLYRLHNDRRITGPSPNTGKWEEWRAKHIFFEKLTQAVKRFIKSGDTDGR